MAIRTTACLLLALCLTGCLPTKPEDLRQASTPKYSLIAPNEATTVTHKLLKRMKQCHEYPIRVQNLPNIKVDHTQSGDTHFISFLTGFTYLIDITVTPTNNNESRVTVGYFSTWESSADAVEKWLNGNWNECRAGENMAGRTSLSDSQYSDTITSKIPYQQLRSLVSQNLIHCWDGRRKINKGPHLIDTVTDEQDNTFITMAHEGLSTYYAVTVDISEQEKGTSLVKISHSPDYADEAAAIKTLVNTGRYSCANSPEGSLLQDIVNTIPMP